MTPRTSASSPPERLARRAGALALLTALLAPPLAAQARLDAAGSVRRIVHGDTLPVPGIVVTLHKVSQVGSGPLDSVRADRGGRFRFSVRRVTGATYLVSARYAGVAYFSAPLGSDPRLDTAINLLVADTSSGAGAPVALEARHIVIEKPAPDGTRRVTDLLVLDNPGPDTRVAPDTIRPAWGTRLPRGVLDPAPGDGDFSPEAVLFRNDSVLVFAPISLGEAQMVVQYTLPADAGVVGFPIEDSIGSLNVLTEEGGARVSGPGLRPGAAEQLDGRDFLRWGGTGVRGSMISVRLGGGAAAPGWILPALIVLLAAGLGAVALRLRRPVVPAARAPAPGTALLVEQVAQLDLRYAGRESEVGGDEWARYLAERARLVRALDTALASGGDRS